MTQDDSKGVRKCPIRRARTLPAVGHRPSQTPGVWADLSGSSLRSCVIPTLVSPVTQLRDAQTNSVRCRAGDNDSWLRHVVQRLRCRWKNNRGAGVRKPHIRCSLRRAQLPLSAVMKGEQAPGLLGSFVYLPSELHPASLGPCSDVFCYVSFQTE